MTLSFILGLVAGVLLSLAIDLATILVLRRRPALLVRALMGLDRLGVTVTLRRVVW